MSDTAFRRVTRADEQQLFDLLHADPWPMFAIPAPGRDELAGHLDAGAYVGDDDEGWWIEHDGKTVGLVRVTDLGQRDGDPLLAIRVLPQARRLGLGRAGTRFATERAFARAEHVRFEAQTRVDNSAMRRTLISCGWVLEACYRRAWPTQEGTRIDSVGYAILRDDWERRERTPIDWAQLHEQDR